ncbi:MAG: NADH-quinone oxidoreductase subunit NuoE [Alphaproteobacteria bacterium]|nr:NADH-quinone oxidoreductase subunit NuoE [Alphaproteobacteria bacterium]
MFTFTNAHKKLIEEHMAKYPSDKRQSALLPVLDIAQRQNGGWLSMDALTAVADVVGISVLKAHEVASFYTMYHLKPVGKYHIQVCGTTPCWLRGAEGVRDVCTKHLKIGMKEVTKDGLFSIEEVECLGACVNAPVVQINDNYFEDLDEASVIALIDTCKKEGLPHSYSAVGRHASEPRKGDDDA